MALAAIPCDRIAARALVGKVILPSCRVLSANSDYLDREARTGSRTLPGKGEDTTMNASKPTKKLRQGKKMARVKPLTEIVISKTADRSSAS